MFHSIITKARDKWFNETKNTAITSLLSYIKEKDKLRDAQLEAIKTYLFLKIECENKPLNKLFFEGKFNSFDLDNLALTTNLREFLQQHKEALSLYEYAKNTNAKPLLKHIESHYKTIDYKKIFDDIFYHIGYTDYLFSLPMGAGKTYLMMAFIYIDLYFALIFPQNTNFANNFLILAPSGLKSSIIPSLKSIERFDIEWLIPNPYANQLKQLIKFEILDENKSAKKSNKTHNPNVAKITQYENPFALVIITNAEKVILDKLDKGDTFARLNNVQKEQWYIANELRESISKINNLSIFIDEVHHAASDDIKLRQVINQWDKKDSINSVIGFSGTPYLKGLEKINITDSITLSHKEISNIVYYYPLIDGINNFLKAPIVKISNDSNRLNIIENGLREFLQGDYKNGLGEKVAIYCGSIEHLEEQIYPKVCEVLSEFKLGSEVILKFHKGNKTYKEPQNAQIEFNNLDSKHSQIKVILLVQIGKEGWDCKSLSGVILSQEGDCPTNMVLQTSCRALRQVEKGKQEKALIYLNEFNSKKLAEQLKQEQKMSLQDFENGAKDNHILIHRYDRSKQVKLPKIDFYQFQLSFENQYITKANPKESLKAIELKKLESIIEKTQDFTGQTLQTEIKHQEIQDYTNFNFWLYDICKMSFHTINMQNLKPFIKELKTLFDTIKDKKSYDIKAITQSVLLCFCDKRSLNVKQELIPQEASLLIAEKLNKELYITPNQEKDFIPNQEQAKRIIQEDNGEVGKPLSEKELQAIELLKQSGGYEEAIKSIESKQDSTPYKDKSYHYIPYRTNSNYEREIYQKILTLEEFKDLSLEAYYNGDSHLSEFKIQAIYNNQSLGVYTPDFLVLQRKDNKISKVLIIESKGEGFAQSFKAKKGFMGDFIKANNAKFGYERFSFLYLQDDKHNGDTLILTLSNHFKQFFKKDKNGN